MNKMGAFLILIGLVAGLFLSGCSTPRQTPSNGGATVSPTGGAVDSAASVTPEATPSESPTDPTEDVEPDAIKTDNLDQPLIPQSSKSPEKVEE